MSRRSPDGRTRNECDATLQRGPSTDELTGRLHVDTEYHGRLLQLPSKDSFAVPSGGSGVNSWSIALPSSNQYQTPFDSPVESKVL